MTLHDEILRLVAHSVWANRQWTEFIWSLPEPEARPLELLGHIMEGERVWFDRIEGKPKHRSVFPRLARDELLRGFEENSQTFVRLIASHLEDVIDFTRASGESYHARVADIIYHLLTHGYHHRGQLATHYARSGLAYPNTDHINFLIVNRM